MRTGRQPVDQVEHRPQGQDAIWAAIRQLGTFTRPQLRQAVSLTGEDTVESYVRRLEAAGIVRYLRTDGRPPRATKVYELVPDRATEETPRVRPDGTVVLMGAGREAMWRSIKILGTFTVDDLVRFGSTEEVPLNRESARDYLKALVAAGYLAVADRPRKTSVPTTYQLVPSKNTGPKAPMVQRSQAVYDPNLKKVVWTSEPEVVE